MSEKKEYQVFIEDAYDEVYDHIIEVEMENRTDKIVQSTSRCSSDC